MSHTPTIGRCPRCNRMITSDCGRFKRHSLTPRGNQICPMSDQHTPITGDTPTDYLSRAYLVADLADQVQDRDTAIVWDVLTAMPAAEVQRLLMISLAAIPTDKPLDEIFGWVCALPAAKEVSA